MQSNINFDVLLEYLSYIKNGTFEQFNRYLDNLDYNEEIESYEYSNIRRMFSRLSHIEFDYLTRTFAVCPPTLLINGNIGILSGYRTKSFLNAIAGKYQLNIIDNLNAPKLIKVSISDVKIFEKDFPEIRISENFSEKIFNIIPDITSFEQRLQAAEYPLEISQININFYNTQTYRFEKIKFRNAVDGLYRALFPGSSKYYFYKSNNWYNVNKEYGIFMAHKYARTKDLIQYKDNCFKLPLYMQFPELIDRALTMLSGKNPYNEKNFIVYENINCKTAEKVVNLLGQFRR